MAYPVRPLTPWWVLRIAGPQFHELWSSVLAICWGGWLANPVNQTFGNSPAWNAVAALASEPVWGLSMMLLGTLHLVALWRRWLWARSATSALAGVLWGIFALAFFEHMRAGLTWVTYGWLALGQLWMSARLQGWVRDPEGGARVA